MTKHRAGSLSADDPQPPVGTIIVDRLGMRWIHSTQPGPGDGTHWLMVDKPVADPEPWARVAGNYGPVRIAGAVQVVAGGAPKPKPTRDVAPKPTRDVGGRPRVGPGIHLRLPADQIERVDQLAEAWKVTRSEAIRRLLEMSLPPRQLLTAPADDEPFTDEERTEVEAAERRLKRGEGVPLKSRRNTGKGES